MEPPIATKGALHVWYPGPDGTPIAKGVWYPESDGTPIAKGALHIWRERGLPGIENMRLCELKHHNLTLHD